MSEVLRQKVIDSLNQAKQVVFGQDNLLEAIVAALVCEGHLLVEGLPGLGKTFSISVMSKICELDFKRVQFTPDLLPSDLVGTMIYSQKSEEFSTKLGPIFTQLLLADEINRSPAKVQSALLESMAERQVTIGEKTHKLPRPFVVLATQNPIEQEGTYPLPEAQLDRFMMKVNVDYPDFDSELSVLDLSGHPLESISTVLNSSMIGDIKQVVDEVYVDPKIKELIIKLVHATRPSSREFLKSYENIIQVGASPRASIWLYKLARFQAFLSGDDHVNKDHILKIAAYVLGHRIILSYEAQVDGCESTHIAHKLAMEVLA